MKTFLDKDFLLNTKMAERLYHEHASKMPIIDYHCHLDPKMVADDYRFKSITELWLGGDHYKWRALRSNGIDEHYITGNASDWEKFEKWAETMPYCMRNPLYHWTHLELRTAFGIDKILKPETARAIYDECNEKLQQPGFTARGFMRRYNVELVCTTDDPADTLEHHLHYASEAEGGAARMLPTWRPDKAMAIENPKAYADYLGRLSKAADTSISDYKGLIDALQKRHDYFATLGCRLSDHGLSEFYAEDYTDSEIERIFGTVLAAGARGETAMPVSLDDMKKFKTAILLDLARMDARDGWTQQFHYGVIRNSNTRMMQSIGPDTGFDSIGEWNCAEAMARFFDRLEMEDMLPRTILYPINPNAFYMIGTMIGNFQKGPVKGKIQFGSGWWFNDQKYGIEEQLNALSMLGLLSRFVGMLTDSRSFLSYPRHEYFRRLLCDMLGKDIERGELPESELPFIGQMVEDICYNNAKNYFQF